MNYYYLIASLPELSLEEPLTNIDVNDTLDFILRNLNENDQKCCKYLIYQNDNKNLVKIILEKYQNIPIVELGLPSSYSSDQLAEFLKNGVSKPDYIFQYLVKYKDQFDLLRPSRIEEYLWIEFYDELESLDNAFIVNYYKFDRILRQLATIHNTRLFELSLLSEFVNDKINRELGISRPKTVISKMFPFVKALWKALESKDPLKIEKSMDNIRWDFIENYDPLANFSNNQVFAWVMKFIISSRWATLTEEKGKKCFIELCEKAIEVSGLSEIENYDQR